MQSRRILVVSSHTSPTMTAPINHAAYCRRHGYEYLFDTTPYLGGSIYDQKLFAVLSALPRAEWVMWLDDDLYIIDQSAPLEKFTGAAEDALFIFCNSPVSPDGEWTILNSGAFLVRNCPEARALLVDAINSDLAEIRAWWKDAEHGLFTGGDQDKLVYTFVSRKLIGTAVQILSFEAFNARDYHFMRGGQHLFACHFCGYEDKSGAVRRLGRRLGLDQYLLDPAESAGLSPQLSRSLFWRADNKPRRRPGTDKVLRRWVRSIKRAGRRALAQA